MQEYPCLISLQVSTKTGRIVLYGAKKYIRPSQSAYDVKLESGATDNKTGVLYVRGTDPIYINVTHQLQSNTCSGTYTLHVKQGKYTFNGK